MSGTATRQGKHTTEHLSVAERQALIKTLQERRKVLEVLDRELTAAEQKELNRLGPEIRRLHKEGTTKNWNEAIAIK